MGKENALKKSLNKCGKRVDGTLLQRSGKNDSYIAAAKAFEEIKRSSKGLIEVKGEILQVYRNIKYFFKQISKILGYSNKFVISRGEKNPRLDNVQENLKQNDNIQNLYRWFNLYEFLVTDEAVQEPYMNLKKLSKLRNDYEHHFSSKNDWRHGEYIEVTIKALNDISDILDRLDGLLKIEKRKREERVKEKKKDDWDYGFIANMYFKRNYGFITTFKEGDEGNSTYFREAKVKGFLPKEGFIVRLKKELNQEHDNYDAKEVRLV